MTGVALSPALPSPPLPSLSSLLSPLPPFIPFFLRLEIAIALRIKPGLGSLAANEQREWEEWKGGKTREEGGRRGPEEGEGVKAAGCRGEGEEGGKWEEWGGGKP